MADFSITTVDADGRVRFRFTRGRTPMVTGRQQLAQQFVCSLLKQQGAEAMAPNLGGGLRQVAGQVYTEEGFRGAAMSSAALSSRQIRTVQTESRVPARPTESLVSAAVVKAVLVTDASRALLNADLTIALTSAEGPPQVLTVNAAGNQG